MKSKTILCLAAVLGGIGSAFALASFVQLKPDAMRFYPNILIRSDLATGDRGSRDYCIVLLPQKFFHPADWEGHLEICEGTNRLASCSVAGVMLSDVPAKGWSGALKSEYYWAMTNRFSQPLNGAKVFRFQAATNVLASSKFAMWEGTDTSYQLCFSLIDFSDAK